ncbi:prolyl oligopeptidase family serine peptidase [Actinopolymorpha sp. NPDC004070]|uniref:prolyl oligopeptidase family serine peptidase n=1 Tax=Actinopolymorpha sp. NPDC004070 TaxID=3154548 RepID=UPI0033B70D28
MVSARFLGSAALGFAVVAHDGRGTPGRGKAFHDAAYGDADEAWHVEDHVMAIRQLAERHPCTDAGQVEVYGLFGGGFASARAMFTRPDLLPRRRVHLRQPQLAALHPGLVAPLSGHSREMG